MTAGLKISRGVEGLLRCPCCGMQLRCGPEEFNCCNAACSASFPVVDGIPILLNEGNSLFSKADFTSRCSTTVSFPKRKVARVLTRLIPSVSANIKAKRNYRRLAGLLASKRPGRPKILVLGGRILGQSFEILSEDKDIELIETDVSFGPRTQLICDAHDIPFKDGVFDAVIAQAVLEHVVDPYRCVGEIHRVLDEGGIVYAETPFMQQVHMGRFDFTRFTHLGHRRLFREFEEIESGVACGPGMALAWSYQYFLLSFFKAKPLRLLVLAFARFTSFYLKYLDYYLADKPGALDAASGYFFMGRKADRPLDDRELIQLYAGHQ